MSALRALLAIWILFGWVGASTVLARTPEEAPRTSAHSAVLSTESDKLLMDLRKWTEVVLPSEAELPGRFYLATSTPYDVCDAKTPFDRGEDPVELPRGKCTKDAKDTRSLIFIAPLGLTDEQISTLSTVSCLQCISLHSGGHPRINDKLASADFSDLRKLPVLEAFTLVGTKIVPKQLDPICSIPSLKYLAFRDVEFTATSQKSFAKLRNLQSFRVYSCETFDDKGIRAIKHLENLKVLQLNQTGISDSSMLTISNFKELRFLSLSRTDITDKGFFYIRYLMKLKKLYLSRTSISDKGMESVCMAKDLYLLSIHHTEVADPALFSIARCKSLEHLYLSNTRITDNGLRHLKSMSSLTRLDITSNSISDAGMVHLGEISQLTCLLIAGSDVTDKGVESIKDLTKLRRLDLRVAGLTDKGLKVVQQFKELRWLNIGGTEVTDEGVTGLTELVHLYRLELSDCGNLTDATMDKLSKLESLTYLNVECCWKITKAAILKFERALPSCELKHSTSDKE